MELERIYMASPAYDKRREGYGIHGVELRFYLKGEHGVIQFIIGTGWLLPETIGATGDKISPFYDYAEKLFEKNRRSPYPMPMDIGYHSPVPHYEDQSKYDCTFLDQGFCYYDGSSLNAMQPFIALVRGGYDAMWKCMEEYYNGWLVNYESD